MQMSPIALHSRTPQELEIFSEITMRRSRAQSIKQVIKITPLTPTHPAYLECGRPKEVRSKRIYEVGLATSKYPRTSLTPELKKKMQLIAGYHKLMQLHIEPPSLSKAPTTPEIRRPRRCMDPGGVLLLPKRLAFQPRCSVCRNVFCTCVTTVSDHTLDDLKARFEAIQRSPSRGGAKTAAFRTRSQRAHRHTASPNEELV